MGSQPAGMHPPPSRAEEECYRIANFAKPRARVCEVALHPIHRPRPNGDVPVLSTFPLFDAQHSALKIYVVHVQVAQITPSNAGGIEHFENGAVPQAEWSGDIGNPQDPLDFAVRQDRLWQTMFCPRHFEFGRRIEGDDSLSREPTHETRHRREPLPLCAVGEWTTTLLAVMKQVTLVIQNCLATDCAHVLDATLFAGFPEMPQLLGLAEDGLGAVVAHSQMLKVLGDQVCIATEDVTRRREKKQRSKRTCLTAIASARCKRDSDHQSAAVDPDLPFRTFARPSLLHPSTCSCAPVASARWGLPQPQQRALLDHGFV